MLCLSIVGTKPVMPQKFDGILIDPPKSVPNAKGETPSASIAASPPDDPPGVLSLFKGCLARPHTSLFQKVLAQTSDRLPFTNGMPP